MNTLAKNVPATEIEDLVAIMKDQNGSAFRVLTTGGAYFDINLMPGKHTHGESFGMKCFVRQVCQIKHGIAPITQDGMAPTMFFNPGSRAIIFVWEGSLPSSISPQYLHEVYLLPQS